MSGSTSVNGRAYPTPTEGGRLLDWLRGELSLTGAKEGCGTGQCGACTVLVDGEPALACCLPAILTEGAKVLTAEGIAESELGNRIVQAFVDNAALQCGFCTPGMVALTWFILSQPDGSRLSDADEAVRHALRGNVCRCTGYAPIVAAIRQLLSEAPQQPPPKGAGD